MTWYDDLKTIRTAIPSVASNREQLEAFQRFFEINPLFSEPMKLSAWFAENLSIFPCNLIYEHYEADTEADKVGPHHCYVYGSFCTFYFYGVLLQWLAKTFLINLLQKGLICAR